MVKQKIGLLFVAIVAVIALFIGILSGGFPASRAQPPLLTADTAGESASASAAAALTDSTGEEDRIEQEAPSLAPVEQEAIASLEGRLKQIYQEVNPAVVHIQSIVASGPAPAIPEVPGFPGPGPGGPNQPAQATGSGFLWDRAGHIVTNNHVIEGAQRVLVAFEDGVTVPAEIIGTDPESDLAVLRVDLPAEEMPNPVSVADSTALEVGDLAIAIGNPFAQKGTMTVGIISALGRQLPAGGNELGIARYSIPDIIQTDAAINPGNSGGVLLNDQGELVGVTTAIISPARVSAGIGFAVPSIIVQKVVPALIEEGFYAHPYLGISGITLFGQIAEVMELDPAQRGALVIDLQPGGPADKGGIRGSDREVTIEGLPVLVGGDVIVAIEGEPVREFNDLVTYLARYTEVGDTIDLTVLREGEEQTVEVTLQARPTSETPRNQEAISQGARLGIIGLTLLPEIAAAMELPEEQTGVLVQQVDPGSAADQAGLTGSSRPITLNGQQLLVGGDIIIGFNGEPVASIEDLQRLLQAAQPGDQVTLTLLRDGEQIEAEVTLGATSRGLP